MVSKFSGVLRRAYNDHSPRYVLNYIGLAVSGMSYIVLQTCRNRLALQHFYLSTNSLSRLTRRSRLHGHGASFPLRPSSWSRRAGVCSHQQYLTFFHRLRRCVIRTTRCGAYFLTHLVIVPEVMSCYSRCYHG